MDSRALMELIFFLAPYIDRWKMKNPVAYTVTVLTLYGVWGIANHLMLNQAGVPVAALTIAKVLNVSLPGVMGMLQSRTASFIPPKPELADAESIDIFPTNTELDA